MDAAEECVRVTGPALARALGVRQFWLNRLEETGLLRCVRDRNRVRYFDPVEAAAVVALHPDPGNTPEAAAKRAELDALPWDTEYDGETDTQEGMRAHVPRAWRTFRVWTAQGKLPPVAKRRKSHSRAVAVFSVATAKALHLSEPHDGDKAKDAELRLAGNSFPEAPEPTQSEPGSEERIRVYEWRVRHGYAVFRTGDKVRKPRRGEFS